MAGAVACSLALSPTSMAWAQTRALDVGKAAAGATPTGAAPAGATPSAAAAAAGATAAPKVDLAAAKKHYGEGEKKFKAGDFAGALSEFEEANDIKSTPHAERYLGLCEDALGHFPAAAEWYDKFLAHVPDKMGTEGDEAKKRVAEIKAMPGKVHVDSTPAGAALTVDDKPATAGAAPPVTPAEVELAPGSHTLKLTLAGHVASSKPVDVAFASTQTVSVTLDAELAPPPVAPSSAPVAESPPPPPLQAEPRSKVPAFVTGGLAIAAAGVGTVFGIIALHDKSDYDSNPTSSKADDGDTHALIADMAFGVALTFGVTSAVLFLTKDEPPPTPATSRGATPHTQSQSTAIASDLPPDAKAKTSRLSITPTPIVGPHLGGAGFVLRF